MKCAVLSLVILFITISICWADHSYFIGEFEKKPTPGGNIDLVEFLKKIGYSDDMSQFIHDNSINIKISKDESRDVLTYKVEVGGKIESLHVQTGVELTEVLLDGRKCQAKYLYKDKALIIRYSSCGNLKITDYAQFSKDGMTLVRETSGAKSLFQYFKRV